MSGHSKWNNIKNRKGAQDQRRSKAFFDVAKMIRVAVKHSQVDDPNMNPGLRLALDKARAVNMPKENIDRAIDRAMGRSSTGESIQEVVYEGYGPHGSGFIVVVSTDNVQRTAGNIRFAFTRHGGALSGPGSVMYMFTRDGGDFVCTMPMEIPAEQSEEVAELYQALTEDDDVVEVYTNVSWEGKDDETA
jgi:YebC/PmpR family DNA-binding regulatory protein